LAVRIGKALEIPVQCISSAYR